MKKISSILISLFLYLWPHLALGNGVLVVDAAKGKCIPLSYSDVNVMVDNQVAIITTTQFFRNADTASITMKYAFPVPEGASATRLRWKRGNDWYTAVFSATKQDTSLPGGTGTIASSLSTYLGATPLYFGFDFPLKGDSVLAVELTYVQLLPYKNGLVNFSYPNDYHLIQTAPLDSEHLSLSLSSQRTIETLQCTSHGTAVVQNTGHDASLTLYLPAGTASTNYVVKYALSLSDLGLYSFSTKIPDSLGYFTFIAEPSPTDSAVIPKNFILIVDRSGSMAGTKMTQAINAATYIVNNLNEGDKFDIIDFDDVITKYRPQLVNFTPENRDSALSYISSLYARNGTDIATAFLTAIPLFASTSDTSANLIIFLTDGQPTVGVTDMNQIISLVSDAITQIHKKVYIFNFGIGSDANVQLLSLLASQNGGIAQFLGNDDLESSITDFYNTVRYPLITDPTLTFSSPLITEAYPNPLPNLYKGQQLIVSGLYSPTDPVTVTFSGTAFGKPVTYKYTMPLADTSSEKYSFLPKVWAKQKIDFLLQRYYTYDPSSGVAKELKEAIISLSVSYGVMSPFTSLAVGGGGSSEVREGKSVSSGQPPLQFQLLGNYPNPFNGGTMIKFRTHQLKKGMVLVRIYNVSGQLVRIIPVGIAGDGEYGAYWDGKDQAGKVVASGPYFYLIDFGEGILGGRMTLLK
ncbi:MAG TPA: VWA domain-containing protein [Bacteroidota bacterium]|nr:VWA domain-containing protein [Bacteroidota bacterium]